MAENGQWKQYGANVKIDPNVCYYCKCNLDDYSRTTDHLIPESQGGIRSNSNKVPSCRDCNQLKGDMTPDEFLIAIGRMIHMQSKLHKKQIGWLKKLRINLKIIIDSKNQPR